jgi:hypothetical protein
MFVLMTALALGLGFLMGAPLGLLALTATLLSIAVPMALTIAVIYGRGWLRTFSIGALFPGGILLLSSMPLLGLSVSELFDFDPRGAEMEDRVMFGVYVVIICAVLAAFGLLAIWVRWMVERSQRQAPTTPVPPPEAPIDVHPSATEPDRAPD